jgi:hypothetical protein
MPCWPAPTAEAAPVAWAREALADPEAPDAAAPLAVEALEVERV